MMRALRLLDDITHCLDFLEAKEYDISIYRNGWDDWLASTINYPNCWQSSTGRMTLRRAELLQALVPLIDSASIIPPVVSDNDITDLLDDITSALADDDTLDPYLRQYMGEHIAHVRTCLDRYRTGGVFDLARALKELELLVAAAQALSRDQSNTWQALRESFSRILAHPMTIALTSSMAPQLIAAGLNNIN